MTVDLTCLCRLCARQCNDMQGIFKNSDFNSEIFSTDKNTSGLLPLKIETVTSIKVCADDGLPTQICSECLVHLNSAITFKEKCLLADSMLRRYLNTANKFRTSNFEIPDERDFISKFIKSTPDGNVIDGDSYEKDSTGDEGADIPIDNNEMNSEDRYICAPCGKRYTLPSAYKKHLSIKHGMEVDEPLGKTAPDRRTCLCNICGKQIASIQLKQHIRNHEHNFQHLCTYCGKKYLTKFRLTQHVRVHTGEKPFSCNICGKKFHEKNLLRSHQRRYLKQKPLECKVCEKRFTNRSHLNTHLMIHTGEKPYSCSQCGSEFRSNNHLKRHWKLHSGEKSYSCSICNKAFIQKSNYMQHLAVHREEKPFKCSECGKGFAYKCSLKMHVEIHRKNKDDSVTLQ
ncbi:hypothetical protein L9F63_015877 [Diploptera punctata]|uniref:Uncharacterized protein n=1 Tax=Diploptera punctata TaxID=6984 RepID=A0AAD8A4U8_DIPPU|nr:hypothetical protein L9F63_015877 [Diploptera punctata]